MSKEKLFTAVLHLAPEDRYELIRALSESLTEEDDPDMTPELSAELDRRIALADRDPSRYIPWEQARARIESKLRKIRRKPARRPTRCGLAASREAAAAAGPAQPGLDGSALYQHA